MALITAAEIISLLLPNKNLDPALIEKQIEPTQRKHIRPRVGKTLYETLIGGSLSSDNQTLVDSYIKKTLANFVMLESLPLIRAQVSNQGVMNNDTEFGKQSSKDEYAYLRQKFDNDGQFEANEMAKYICENLSKYPTYNPERTEIRKTHKGIVFYDECENQKTWHGGNV